MMEILKRWADFAASVTMTNEKQKAIRTLMREPLIFHENIEWLGRCLSVLHPERYCIITVGKSFHIRLSPSALEDIERIPEKEFFTIFDDIKKDMYEDRRKCTTIIGLLSTLQSEEEEKIKKRIALEEDERSKYRRY